MYQYQGRYAEAEPLYKEALQLSEKVLGREHPDTLTIHLNLIALLITMDNDRAAYRRLKKIEGLLFSRSFQELYLTSSERVRRIFLKQISTFNDIVFSFAAGQNKPEYRQLAANIMIHWKQVYAEERAYQHRLLATSKDPEILQLKENMAKFCKELSFHVHQNKSLKSIVNSWHAYNAAETDLREKTRAFKPNLNASQATIEKIIGELPRNSGLLEFRQFTPFEFKTRESGPPHLAAYLLLSDIDADQQLFFEDLGDIETILKSAADPSPKNHGLYNALLGKFQNQMNSLKILYIAPDDFLHLISFAAIRTPEDHYLAENVQIRRLQTGRDLIDDNKSSPANQLIAFGGVDYGNTDNLKQLASSQNTPHLNKRAAQELQNDWSYLEHSLYEAQSIATIFKTNCKGGTATVYKAKNATEAQLKSIARPPRILHLSTHGFFLKNADPEGWAQEEAPLLLSGLTLAGANQGRNGIIDANGDDGLLYSLEVLGLNLLGTELVSLSACDTGKGVVDYSEGVYGLVRAFRTAGAQSVLMTLRPVGDKTSRDFMETFYENWLGGKDSPSPQEALHRTRMAFIHHSIEAYRDPSVWASYVLVGK